MRPVRERQTFVEAEVRGTTDSVLLQWVRDSAYRFFPLLQHAELGLTMHPVDLATNKVLALVGRLEVRDWVDVIECSERLQPLGYLAWAACGKDPGFSPAGTLEQAAHGARYSVEEVAALSFEGPPPNAAAWASGDLHGEPDDSTNRKPCADAKHDRSAAEPASLMASSDGRPFYWRAVAEAKASACSCA